MSVTTIPGVTETQSGSTGPAMGLFQSMHRLVATVVNIVQTRVELLTTELQEEVHYAASLVLWSLVALFTALLGILVGGLTVVFAYWDTHRVLAATLVTVAYFIFAGIAVVVLIAKMKSHRRFLDATLNELARDGEALRSRIRD
jgi:uncharacterized membrane protein YqjE